MSKLYIKVDNPKYDSSQQFLFKKQLDKLQEEYFQHPGRDYMPRGWIK